MVASVVRVRSVQPHRKSKAETDSAPRNMPSKQITYLDIAVHFDLVINKAASLLGVCTTVLKRTCRANGIGRWPQRKLHAITKMMTSLDLGAFSCVSVTNVMRVREFFCHLV